MESPDGSLAAELVELLRWYAAMGADEAVDERPHDRFVVPVEVAAPAPRPPLTARPAAPAPRLSAPSPSGRLLPAAAILPDMAVQAAREAAATAATLEELRAVLERFEGCGLKRMASSLVFADGDPSARVMLVGEAPGAEEDRSGVPFVGRGGRLLDRMLAAIGLDRTGVYIANVVPWRPPGNREPTPQEVAECLPFVKRQIELSDPDILVPMGKAALSALTGNRDGITRARGRWGEYHTGRRAVRMLPMLHPAYLLRQPAHKALAWRDWRTLQAALTVTS